VGTWRLLPIFNVHVDDRENVQNVVFFYVMFYSMGEFQFAHHSRINGGAGGGGGSGSSNSSSSSK